MMLPSLRGHDAVLGEIPPGHCNPRTTMCQSVVVQVDPCLLKDRKVKADVN